MHPVPVVQPVPAVQPMLSAPAMFEMPAVPAMHAMPARSNMSTQFALPAMPGLPPLQFQGVAPPVTFADLLYENMRQRMQLDILTKQETERKEAEQRALFTRAFYSQLGLPHSL